MIRALSLPPGPTLIIWRLPLSEESYFVDIHFDLQTIQLVLLSGPQRLG